MSKYGPKIYPSEIVNTKNHWAVGIVWTAEGSKGNIYNIEMQNKGFSCDCPAFKKCKHIKAVEEDAETDQHACLAADPGTGSTRKQSQGLN